jgi:tetratricopeptide (TPR) repeat protein
LVYFGPFAVLFLKDVPENKKIVDRFAIDLTKWNPPEMDLKKIGATAAYPFPNINRAYVLESLNLNEAVIKEAQAALRIMPNCGSAFRFLGRVYKKQNRLEKAFENLRLAVTYLGGDLDLRTDLALVYWKLGDLDNCLKQLKAAVEINPGYSRAFYYLSLVYLQKKDSRQSQEALTKAIRLKPPDLKDLAYVADSFYDQKYFAEALQVYQQMLKLDKNSAKLHSRLGACYVYLNKLKEAEDELTLAVNLDHKLASVHDYFAVLFAKQGLEVKARQQWGEAFRLDPQDKEAKDNLQKFLKGEFRKVAK